MNKEEIKNLLYALHHSTYRNEQQIKNSKDCGCFHCKTIFKPEDVTDWCDDDGKGDRTGRCPNCRMDSVLGDNSGVDIKRYDMGIVCKTPEEAIAITMRMLDTVKELRKQ